MDPQSDETPEMVHMRLRTYKNEYIVCPEENYTLIVVHTPTYTEPAEEVEAVAAVAPGEGEAAAAE